MKTFKEKLLESIKKALGEELDKQSGLLSYVNDKLADVVDPEKGIISVSPSTKSGNALVVRCEDKEHIAAARKAVKNAVKRSGITLLDRVIAKYDPSIETTVVSYSDDSGRVYVVFKYNVSTREGLALEHVMAMMLTGKITSELKSRLDLPQEANKDQILSKLKTDFADVLAVALRGKSMLEGRVGKITDAQSEGSRNSKADLIITSENGKKYGLSIKLVKEEGREVRFTYNKNLGYGDEQEDNLVKNPSGKPWWLVGRQIFAKKIGRSYNASSDDLQPPSWMEKAKEKKDDLYKESMEEVYRRLRHVFVDNLRHLKLKEIVDMVNEAHLGDEKERNQYEKLFVLSSDVDGIKLKESGFEKPDMEKLQGLNKSDIIKTDGAKIIIEIPGMSPLTIHGLKFHSNMLSSNREDLKIKTR